jgi:hypothetical protein
MRTPDNICPHPDCGRPVRSRDDSVVDLLRREVWHRRCAAKANVNTQLVVEPAGVEDTDAIPPAPPSPGGPSSYRDALMMIRALATDQLAMHQNNGDPLDVTGRLDAILNECEAALRGQP